MIRISICSKPRLLNILRAVVKFYSKEAGLSHTDADYLALAIDEAVTRLAEDDPVAANVVKLHVFAGMTLEETGEALGISRATVYREWAYARSALRIALQDRDLDSRS